jgi:hypothetical protein
MILKVISPLKQNICTSCITITWHCMNHLLVIYDTQSDITIGDTINKENFELINFDSHHFFLDLDYLWFFSLVPVGL